MAFWHISKSTEIGYHFCEYWTLTLKLPLIVMENNKTGFQDFSRGKIISSSSILTKFLI